MVMADAPTLYAEPLTVRLAIESGGDGGLFKVFVSYSSRGNSTRGNHAGWRIQTVHRGGGTVVGSIARIDRASRGFPRPVDVQV